MMRKVLLDLGSVSTPEETQEYLAQAFGFPDFYGRNLDALYDELTSLDYTCIGWYESSKPREIDAYLARVKRVLCDAEAENPRLGVIWA